MKKTRLDVVAALFAASVVLAGCEGCHSHDHPHGDDGHEGAHAPQGEHDEDGHEEEHGDGHGEGAIGITKWTDKLELFAEHPPAITGQELTFLAHLTILDGFNPLENATVTLLLEGPTRVEARVTEKLRSGIFQPTLTAPAAGTYRGSLVVTGPEVEDTIDGFEIVVYPNAEAAQQASAGEEGGGAEPIGFLKEQQWQVPFATAFAATGSSCPCIEVAGEVTTPPSGQAEVGADFAGRRGAPNGGLPRPGQTVRRGERLGHHRAGARLPRTGARADSRRRGRGPGRNRAGRARARRAAARRPRHRSARSTKPAASCGRRGVGAVGAAQPRRLLAARRAARPAAPTR
jgi:membrane fusion protein, heavy metal efflux system